MKINKSKKIKYVLILLGILFFHIFMNYKVLSKSEICRVYDEAGRIANSVRYYNLIFLSPYKFKNIKDNILILHGQAHPPFYEVMGAMACKLSVMSKGEFDEKSIILITNTFFLFILLMSTYCIGATLYDSKVGLLAAFLVSFFPMIFGYYGQMLLDFPLTCMVSLSFYLLFKTDNFKSLGYSSLLGLLFGLSQLTRETFSVYLLFPFIYYFYKSYQSENKKGIILNFLSTLFCAIIVAGVVYLRPDNFLHAFKTYFGKIFFLPSKPLLYYIQNVKVFTGSFVGLAVIPALIGYLMNLKIRNKVILLWIFVPIIIFFLSPNKSCRYLMPILPALALIIAQEIYNNKAFIRLRKIYISFLILVSIGQYSIYSLNLRKEDPDFFHRYYHRDFPGILTVQHDKHYPAVLELLEFFRKEKDESNRKHMVLFLFDIGKIHSPLQYKFELERLPFSVNCPQEADEVDAAEPGAVNWEDYILKADYIIDKSEYTIRGKGGARENVEDQLREGFRRHKVHFKKVADIEIFGGSYLYIYKNLKNDLRY